MTIDNYEKDIDLTNRKIHIRKTQTKNISGKAIIGENAKTENGERTLTMTNISKQIIESALEHKITNKNNSTKYRLYFKNPIICAIINLLKIQSIYNSMTLRNFLNDNKRF